MSLRKKKPTSAAAAKKTLSDTIAELLLPQPLLDPEIDADDETRAQTRAYDDADEELGEIDPQFSAIRKQNVRMLQEVDRKYSGKIASRKDFEEQEDEEEEDDDEEEEKDGEDDYEDSSDDGLAIRSKTADEDTESEDEEEDDDDDDEEEADDGEAKAGDDSEVDDDDDDEDDDDEDEDDEDDDDEDDFDLAPRKSTSTIAEDASATAIPDSTVHVKPANASADLQKGHCVQNQLHIWEKLLEMRIHSQKVLIQANTLPSHEKLAVLNAGSPELAAATNRTATSVSRLFDRLGELQSLLVAKFPETSTISAATRKRKAVDSDAENAGDDALSAKIRRAGAELGEQHTAYTDYRNATLLKWHDRTKVLTPGSREGRHVAQHNILQNIDGILANRGDLVRKSQLHKGGYRIIGQPAVAPELAQEALRRQRNAEAGGEAEAEEGAEAADAELHSAEIYDDSDFYHTQLRELIEFKANAASNPDEMNRQFVELQKLRKKMKKTVDTRASKGRKIRYVVHNKLVNFMARNAASEWTEEGKTELYSSLFGARM